MHLMEERILREGKVLPGGVLKVGSFLNQQMDPALLRRLRDHEAADDREQRHRDRDGRGHGHGQAHRVREEA